MKNLKIILFLLFSVNTFSLTQIITKGNDNEKSIALTFDDGPNDTSMVSILDLLKEYNIKASFFLIGKEINASSVNKKVVKRAYDEGHEISTHSYNHVKFSNLTSYQLYSELENSNNLVYEIIGKKPKIFRAPFGSFTSNGLKIADELDLIPVMWSVDTLDWNIKENKISVIEKVLKNISTNSIILMHTLPGNYKSYEALKVLIPYLQKEGYKFKKVSEIIHEEAYSNTSISNYAETFHDTLTY